MPKRKIITAIGPSIAYLELTKGQFACVSVEDAERFGIFNWCALKCPNGFYAVRRDAGDFVYLHRKILGIEDSSVHVDHRNGWGLHNFPSNLRATDRFGNMRNRRRPSTNTTGYKGVCFHKPARKWMASINGTYLGLFDTPEAAHAAYCEAALRLHGEFASFG